VLAAGAAGFTAGAEAGVGAAVVGGAVGVISEGGAVIAGAMGIAGTGAAIASEGAETTAKADAATSSGAKASEAAAEDTATSGSASGGARAAKAAPKSGTAARGSRGAKGKFQPKVSIHKPQEGWDLETRVSDANALRDSVGTVATGDAKYRTYSAAVNIHTGDVAVGCSGAGSCAEVNIMEFTGWDPSDILFTRAGRLMDIEDGLGKVWQEMEICTTCQGIFPVDSFVPGALLASE
jgi:hypothetical protein